MQPLGNTAFIGGLAVFALLAYLCYIDNRRMR